MSNHLTLSDQQKENVEYIIKRMGELDIGNPFTQAGILAVISKESSFKPKSEHDYAGTSNSRIRKIFGHRVSGLSDSQLTTIKNNPVQFFDRIYGGRYGNAANEGYKYRGRGLNQLTFKANYEKINPFTTKDIVADPDSLNDLPTATEAVIGFFKRAFGRSGGKLSLYHMTTIDDATNTTDAVGAAFHANTGWGKSKTEIEKDRTGGYAKALGRVDQFYEMTKVATSPGKEASHETTTTTPNATPEIIASGAVTAAVLNIRTGPGTNFSTAGSIEKGEHVNVYQESGRWLKISVTEEQWVHGNYVDETDHETSVIATGEITARVLNIRIGPGTNFDKAGTLEKGNTVSVFKKEGRWLKISATEEKWVHGNYVDE
ncbi:MAG: SH3 domain-containing protein [Crocinitomix sp.]|nr:SH3 domain-containing protein [Crocinitomix sp.]